MKNKKRFYLIGNAHLDPVWQWRWQEGSQEAKATIRSALDRMNEFPDFKFVCSSASVYRWIEEFDADMFDEIKQRAKEGRFIVVGGWHVQPDCNSPSGEGFARQSLYSQRYFMEKLGVTAKVGYNVDSFGHNLNIPQILKKSGMSDYVFMRPSPSENNLSSDVFNWVSPDGSSVLTYRILDPYCFNFKDSAELKARIDYLNENTSTDLESIPFFYGVGNHGGGPTITNLRVLEEYKKDHPELEFKFSNLKDFFDEVRNSGEDIPVHTDDLQHHAAGCYANLSHVKKGVRLSENNLISAETYSVLANKLLGKRIPSEKFADAWRNVCFLHFHDIMAGCCIKEADEDSRYLYGMALEHAAVAENNALQSISWAVDTSDDTEKGLPVFVFNPHAFPVRQMININLYAEKVLDVNGNEIEFQLTHSTVNECYERDDISFIAEVPALGWSIYYLVGSARMGFVIDKSKIGNKASTDVFAIAHQGARTSNCLARTVLENEYWRILFDLRTGYIASIHDKKADKEILSDYASVPIVIDEYYHDTWSHAKNYFTDVIARFNDATVSVTENGPLRATVKVVSRYNDSTLTQYFSLVKGEKQIFVRSKVDWHEKHKMLKIKWPFNVENPKAYYEIPFGVIERPCNGEEEPGLSWFGVKGDNGGFAICNTDTYSSSVENGTLLHTILRSPIYGDHGGPRDEESEFTEQGVREFNYTIVPFESNSAVIKYAKILNTPVTNIIENWHSGKIKNKSYSAISLDKDNVMISAIKRSEDGKGLVIRLYETDGVDTDVTVCGDLLRIPLKTKVGAFAVNTYLLNDDEKVWKEVLLSEFDIEG